MSDEEKKTEDTVGYKYVGRPLYKLGQKLSGETDEQAAKRLEDAASKIESGKTFVKDSSWPKQRAKELRKRRTYK